MGDFFNQLPEQIQYQVKDITKSSGLEDNEESLELMAKAWIDKKEVFEEKIGDLGMEECDTFDRDNEQGAIVLTYSGSLINVGPLVEGSRNVEYTSIGLRSDVPDSANNESSRLGEDINIDEGIKFEVGPVKSTSAVFKIAVIKDELSAEEEEEKLAEATIIIADEFAEINKTIIVE
jgi:hypothetical protein